MDSLRPAISLRIDIQAGVAQAFRRLRFLKRAVVLVLAAVVFTLPIRGQTTANWVASGASGNWSTTAHWSGDVPLNAYYLNFGIGTRLTSNVDTPVDVNFFNGITFSGANSFTITGNELGMVNSFGTALITNNSTATQTINTPLNLNGVTPTIDTASGNINLGGVIRSTGGLTKTGNAALTLGSANTYTGVTTIGAGTVNASKIRVTGGNSSLGNATSAVVLGSATSRGTLSYTGGAVTYTRGFTINAGGGQLAHAGTGLLTVSNGVIAAGGLFTVGGASGKNITISSVISGIGGVTKTGADTVTLSGANTYAGQTTVSGGTLQVSGGTTLNPTLGGTSNVAIENGGTLRFSGTGGTNNKVVSGKSVTMGGGAGSGAATLHTGGLNGLDQTFGALTLTANSVIDFGALASGSQSLRFAASNADWTGLALSVWNWTAGVDHLYFGTSSSGLNASQLSQISFYGDSGTGFLGTAGINSSGELSVIPEPSTVFGLVGLAGLVGWRERKRLRGLLVRSTVS